MKRGTDLLAEREPLQGTAYCFYEEERGHEEEEGVAKASSVHA